MHDVAGERQAVVCGSVLFAKSRHRTNCGADCTCGLPIAVKSHWVKLADRATFGDWPIFVAGRL